MRPFISLASGWPSVRLPAWSLTFMICSEPTSLHLSTRSIIYVGKEHSVRIRVSGKTCIDVLSDMKLYPNDPPHSLLGDESSRSSGRGKLGV